ncbi:hypothetical protein QJS04_geneDACA010158 [Acorus gramineus]|uniref:Uncharacterized protein n=1 Tax=Acorus gramineus TaxID=55184 RepID=A0AAV9A6K1_ACOGR|nr:hypothetical protein QJS04_geneDACA010158 [Acorus gramineus]
MALKKSDTTPPMNARLMIRKRRRSASAKRPQPPTPSKGSPPQHNSVPNTVARSTTQILKAKAPVTSQEKKPSPGTPPQHN